MLRYEGKRYRARFETPVWVEHESDVEEVTRQLAAVLEGWIREAPEQWPWFEDRWKSRRRATP
jgi:lauroyl/myristoyl acyltransferase